MPSANSAEMVSRAIAALNGQRPQEAERIAGEVLKTEPHHTRALHVLGTALRLQGRAQEAIAPLESATRNHHDPEIETQLALALRQAGRIDGALAAFKRATRRQPAYALAFCEHGHLLLALERYDEAIEVLNRGFAVAPMMPDLSIQLGYAFLQRRDCVAAKTAFSRALGLAPTSPDALFGLARAHQELGENEPAAELFRRGLRSRPNDANLWLSLGHCLLELGQRDAGYDCFRTAARGDAKRYGSALSSLVKAGRGRFWLRPSDAARFLQGK